MTELLNCNTEYESLCAVERNLSPQRAPA